MPEWWLDPCDLRIRNTDRQNLSGEPNGNEFWFLGFARTNLPLTVDAVQPITEAYSARTTLDLIYKNAFLKRAIT
jgi:hypothetical protein